MKLSTAIDTLNAIKEEFGDIEITGGYMQDDQPLSQIVVTDVEGMEIWPKDVNDTRRKNEIDGVYLTS